jgi:hypothetical protein
MTILRYLYNTDDIERLSADRFSVVAAKIARSVKDASCRLNDEGFWQEAYDNGPSKFLEKK